MKRDELLLFHRCKFTKKNSNEQGERQKNYNKRLLGVKRILFLGKNMYLCVSFYLDWLIISEILYKFAPLIPGSL